MANTKSALKRMKQAEIRRQRNKQVKTRIKNAVRKFLSSLEGDDQEVSRQNLISAVKVIDKAASKGVIHKRTAARKKSRLAKKLNQSRQAG
ncbi:MAG: 30S ribosomal protein S20 [Firmicutes bacterium]|nr:30S ribosomal protein S20 [Bacillota bacterium]